MEPLRLSPQDGQLHIEGYPNAEKVVAIDGPKAQRLAHLSLHRNDLERARSYLEAIKETSSPILRQSAWLAAIVLFMKCFQHSIRRGQLDPKKVFGDNVPALAAFEYFKALRNKHIVHDENDYTQARPGAIINKPSEPFKIAKIVVTTVTGETLEAPNFKNLLSLIGDASRFVEDAFGALAVVLTDELEREPREALLHRPSVQLTAPNLAAIAEPRSSL